MNNAANYATLDTTWSRASNLNIGPYDYFKNIGKWSTGSCPTGQHFHPGHPKAFANGCMKDSDMTVEGYYSTLGNSYTQAGNVSPYNSIFEYKY